jgi:antitoxin component of MazEF toxin-antitoxin module
MTDHKDYSLKQLENFLYDAMSTESSSQEIYDVIKGVVEDNYNVYKNATQKAYELLALLNGNGEENISDAISRGNKVHQSLDDILVGIHNDCRIPCDMEALKYTDEEMDAMTAAAKEEEYLISEGYFKEDGFWKKPKDEVKKWVLPIEEIDCDECIINFPDDLLEAANLKEGDEVEWIDQGDGSFKMIKVTKPLGIDKC